MRMVSAGFDEERRLRALLVIVLVATSVGGGIDLYLDAPETWWSVHAIYELVLITAAIAMASVLWHGWWRSRRTLAETERALARHADAVDERFSAWELTPAEREIALRLLKGHSHKQIAYEIGRSERTVRQHAVSVYQKSGLSGRAELSAFFLDDLLLPALRE